MNSLNKVFLKIDRNFVYISHESIGHKTLDIDSNSSFPAIMKSLEGLEVVVWGLDQEVRVFQSLGITGSFKWIDAQVAYRLLHNGSQVFKDLHYTLQTCCQVLDIEYTEFPLPSVAELIFKQCEEAGITDSEIYYFSAYCFSQAQITAHGIPIDSKLLKNLCSKSVWLQESLIYRLNTEIFPFYEKTKDRWVFKANRFERYLRENNLIDTWPRSEKGNIETDSDTLQQYGDSNILKLAKTQGQIVNLSWFEGHTPEEWNGRFDGRRIYGYHAPLATVTGRHADPAKTFPLSYSSWQRAIISPDPGRVFVCADFSSQEFGIAAGYFGDSAMIKAYNTTDPYWAMAVQTGAIPDPLPSDKTPLDYKPVRTLFKSVCLGLLYGMGPNTLAHKLSIDTGRKVSIIEATKFRDLFRDTYFTFWTKSIRLIKDMQNMDVFSTADHWRIYPKNVKYGTLKNFPIQATAQVILRLSVMKALKAGLKIIYTYHDCITIECLDSQKEEQSTLLRSIMEEMSQKILPNIHINTSVKIYHPDYFWVDPKGVQSFEFFAPLLGWKYEKEIIDGNTFYKRS